MTTAIQALKQRNEMAMSASPLSTLLRPSFNELRKIKIGCCKPGTGNQTVKSPVKLDHFIITELGDQWDAFVSARSGDRYYRLRRKRFGSGHANDSFMLVEDV